MSRKTWRYPQALLSTGGVIMGWVVAHYGKKRTFLNGYYTWESRRYDYVVCRYALRSGVENR
jgi:hypothetical protein